VGDRRNSQHVIRTVHGQGYRFVAPVVEQSLAAVQQSVPMGPSETLAADASPASPLPPSPAVSASW
jgi:DNA-binding winged helix-turn-helix (wHTH) protein